MALDKYFSQLETDKKRLAKILRIRGVVAADDETYTTLVSKVNQITGSKFAPVYISFADNLSENLDDELRCISFDNMISFRGLFSGCENLLTIDTSLLPGSNKIVDMGIMFQSCKLLTELDVSHFNTSNVTSMGGMFNGCRALKKLDLRNFDTKNVTAMSTMFQSCSNMEELDISSFNTSAVTNMSRMFYAFGTGPKVIKTLDLRHFDVTNVIDMQYMFYNCTGLTTIDLSTWDTPNIQNVSYMFYGCSSLSTLDLRNFDFTKITNSTYYSNVFNGVPNGCRVIVKDEANKTWCLNKKSFTNIKTVDEL